MRFFANYAILLGLAVIAVLMAMIQSWVMRYLSLCTYYDTIQIYAFHCILMVIMVIVVKTAKVFLKDMIGFAFLSMTVFRMLASVIFFFPVISHRVVHPIAEALTFMIPYFVFLFGDTLWAYHFIKANDQSEKK